LRRHLIDAGALDEAVCAALEASVVEEVADAATWAAAQPDAAPEAALEHTWADRPVDPPAWMSLRPPAA
jgi:TPP-dependent pyruvate/acetoin dehydrogenase alpha subunit